MSEKKNNKKKKKIQEEKVEEVIPEPISEDNDELQEIENPYTVTNRAIDELVNPKDTMFYLSESQIRLILTAFEFARLPSYFGEEPVTELAEFANRLRYYLVSKGGRGRRDILRVLRVSSSQVRENVNKSLFKQFLGGGDEDEQT
jgi:hypothetical protein